MMIPDFSSLQINWLSAVYWLTLYFILTKLFTWITTTPSPPPTTTGTSQISSTPPNPNNNPVCETSQISSSPTNPNNNPVCETSQISSSPPNPTDPFCEFCGEPKPEHELFRVKDCNHAYCLDCVSIYVESKFEENITSIKCLESDCVSEFEPKSFALWSSALQGPSSSSGDLKSVCEFCMESKSENTLFRFQGCNHAYCSECISLYLESKIQENLTLIKCPEINCLSVLELESFGSVLARICEICTESKTEYEFSTISPCNHSYCSDCISKYVESKIEENVDTIKCLDINCSSSLELEFCETFLPENVFTRWSRLLCESSISGAQKLYCPFKDCSALLIDDGDGIIESECSYCHRLFCAQCKVPWHSGFTCDEFQNLPESERNGDDIKLMDLAKNKKWQRCPKCMFYVEKIAGCTHMNCRCGFGFCYECGVPRGADQEACNCRSSW